MRNDGTERHILIDSEWADYSPIWSPDGKYIAVERSEPPNVQGDEVTAQSNIFVVSLTDTMQAGQVVQLTDMPGSVQDIQWSPDGNQILFAGIPDEDNTNIFVVNVDGTGITQLTDTDSPEGNASWSPDGSRIVYNVFKRNKNEIWVIQSDGLQSTYLTDGYWPVWSPDGSHIAFVDADNQIAVINTDGSDLTTVTKEPDYYRMQPMWLSDGQRIIYAAMPEVCRFP